MSDLFNRLLDLLYGNPEVAAQHRAAQQQDESRYVTDKAQTFARRSNAAMAGDRYVFPPQATMPKKEPDLERRYMEDYLNRMHPNVKFTPPDAEI